MAIEARPGGSLPESSFPLGQGHNGRDLECNVRARQCFGLSTFPAIADYGFLSDCEVTALVASTGNVEWMCLPRMDAPSVFAAMLDRGAGGFRFGPADAHVPSERRYLPGSMVLETAWECDSGWLIVRDALLVGPWWHQELRSAEHRRPPTDHEAEHVLLRTAWCASGEVPLRLRCEPSFDYGRRRAHWEYAGDGYHRAVATGDDMGLECTLSTDLRLGFEDARAIGRTLMKEGDKHFCALSWCGGRPPADVDEAEHRLQWAVRHWQRWLRDGDFPEHEWRSHLTRSALTLKGLTYAPTGAVAAAATTSLPETYRGQRNWDYRYSWIRDATFTLWGFYSLGLEREAEDYFSFLSELAERDGDLQIVYGINGERELDERVLHHLHGYEAARPVRVGNEAYRQRQHDVWGVMLDSLYLHTKTRDGLDERTWPIIRHQVDSALDHWREPDCGIWEVRGEPRHFTSSKVMCWVAVDRGARLACVREDHDLAEKWRRAAEEIRADICAHGVDRRRGVFTQHYDTTALDASLLLMPMVGFLPPDDPRIRATVLAIADELSVQGLIKRYDVEKADDGLPDDEATFAMCSFWLVSALCEIGEQAKARRLCEKLLALSSPLRLYAEEIDPETGRHYGNFPQAFTHIALINAVTRLIREEQEITRMAGLDTPEHLMSPADLRGEVRDLVARRARETRVDERATGS